MSWYQIKPIKFDRKARVTQKFKMISLEQILKKGRIIPVLTIRNIEDAVPLAEAIFEREAYRQSKSHFAHLRDFLLLKR